ncbi:MAG TPA: substrate-binding domain-containing protein [Planctomycetaceae bacterium]|jgi:ribose transport system substrate-binding protein|nr:substrate-binding domain-containing protein [Planctomycetaceae bacterium]
MMRSGRWYAALVLLACGCSGGATPQGGGPTPAKGDAGATGGKTYRIAVIPKGTTHEFWKSVHFGAEKAAKELGNVQILWKGPVLENDREGQIQVVQDFIVQKADGICLAPLDSRGLVEYVEEAAEKNVPVVIFDSGLDKEDKIVSYVATDNFKGGELAGHRLAEAMGKKGNAILLRYNQGSESTEQREEGFLKCLAENYANIKVISSDQYAGTTPEQSLEKAQQILQKYKDEVNGIFAVCEPNATGVLGALQEQELSGKVKFVAFDPNVPLVNGLKDNKVDGIVLQDPVQMGYDAVMTMMKHIKGEPVEKRISTGEYVATPENMTEEKMAKLLKPEQFGQ